MGKDNGANVVKFNRKHELLLMLIFGIIAAIMWFDVYLKLSGYLR